MKAAAPQMSKVEVNMKFTEPAMMQQEFVQNLQHGRCFVPATATLQALSECTLVLEHPDGGKLALDAQVVLVTATGLGLQLRPADPSVICGIERFVMGGGDLQLDAPVESPNTDDIDTSAVLAGGTEPSRRTSTQSSTARSGEYARTTPDSAAGPRAATLDDPALDDGTEPPPSQLPCEADWADANDWAMALPDDGPGGPADAADVPYDPALSDRQATTRIQQLRHLTLNQQHKLARRGDLSDRVQLERLYGKAVWEPLLANPKVTIPEIARIARKGTVPRILLEQIIDNRTWVNATPVRRALLSNPRVGPDGVMKLLRCTPRHELKIMQKGTAHSAFIRDQARKLLLEHTR